MSRDPSDLARRLAGPARAVLQRVLARPARPRARGGRPRVLLASRIYLPEPGAASFRLDNLSRAVVRAGGVVDVLTTTVPHYPPAPVREGVRVHRWPARRDANGYIRGYVEYLSFDIPLLLRLLVARERPSVMVCEPPPTTGAVVRLVSTLTGVPYVYYAGDVWSEALKMMPAPRPVVSLLSWIERWAMRGSAAILAVSPQMAAAIERMPVSVPVHMIGNGVDTEVFSPSGPATHGPGDYFVYTGTASEVHGALVFVDAFERLRAERPDLRLVFVGQGTDFPAIQERADRLPPGAIQVVPRQPPAETADWIRGARAALASVRPGAYGFAFPSKALAAAACGVPVVMASPPQTRQAIVDGDLGWAVDFDVDAVTDAMRAALEAHDDDAERARRAAWAHRTASLALSADRGAAVILSVAGQAPRTTATTTPTGADAGGPSDVSGS